MSIRKIFKMFAKQPARNQVSRSPANRAHPHLEALETRMVLSDLRGAILTNMVAITPVTVSQTGQ
jgi:hypothetical protein